MTTKTQTIQRYDHKVATEHQANHGTPRYRVEVLGELLYFYIDTPSLPDHLKDVSDDAAYLVSFGPTDRKPFQWAYIGGAATLQQAEELLEAMADGRDGRAFIVPTPSR